MVIASKVAATSARRESVRDRHSMWLKNDFFVVVFNFA
jgi:hypothetical protein